MTDVKTAKREEWIAEEMISLEFVHQEIIKIFSYGHMAEADEEGPKVPHQRLTFGERAKVNKW
ncbi:MAG: hypothetical protein C5B49_16250 [Bdellovibrio sp.]|nr:MAG: hypothetical protein C5B49_16250 [Bdellovibrio sp.]